MINVQLIPRPLWGRSLANRCKTSWRKIRAMAHQESWGFCQCCLDPLPDRWIAHEAWRYDEDQGTATLADVIAVCPLCSDALHIGRTIARSAETPAYASRILAHVERVNGRRLDVEAVMETWRRRSGRDWRIELGRFGHLMFPDEYEAVTGRSREDPPAGENG